jgi:hypothetical protein
MDEQGDAARVSPLTDYPATALDHAGRTALAPSRPCPLPTALDHADGAAHQWVERKGNPTTTRGFERRRTVWDVVLGILLILAGFFVLGNVVFATALSVLLLGWIALGSGVVLLIQAFFRIRSGEFWFAALGGAVLAVLGLFILRHPVVGA